MQQISPDTPVGHTVTGRTKKVTSYRTWLFSGGWPRFDGWPAKNVHTDLAAAQASGLPTRAASGAMCLGYLTELLVDLFGEAWLSYGMFDTKFIGIIDAGDDIVSKARVTDIESTNSGVQFSLDVWCENQDGTPVVVGTASGRLE
ncbi:MAG: MaoC family dehydratase [Chloroflexi bacterium]|nr:MaoC family dehydratase [Chloroflexota bacterium]